MIKKITGLAQMSCRTLNQRNLQAVLKNFVNKIDKNGNKINILSVQVKNW